MSLLIVDITVNAGTKSITIRNINRGASMKFVPIAREQLVANRLWRVRHGQKPTLNRESIIITIPEDVLAARALPTEQAFSLLASWMEEKKAIPQRLNPQMTPTRCPSIQTLTDVYAAAHILNMGNNLRIWRKALLTHISMHVLSISEISMVWKKLSFDSGVVQRMVNSYFDQLERGSITDDEDTELCNFLYEKEPELDGVFNDRWEERLAKRAR